MMNNRIMIFKKRKGGSIPNILNDALKQTKETLYKIKEPNELLKYYHDRLSPNTINKKERGEVFTPIELVEEMLDKLPEEVWTNPNLKWLDPACGIGNFPYCVYMRLMKELKKKIPDDEKRRAHILEEMLFMVENGIRGGISMISHRYAKANNKYMTDYDESKEDSYIIYEDANNLYALAMSLPLPFQGFEWVDVSKFDIDEINKNPSILNGDASMFDIDFIKKNPKIFNSYTGKGYILEVDLEYPDELHDLHNDYPLAPERLTIRNNMLSNWATNQQNKLDINESKVPKLVPNLLNKTKYILHYENLRYYIQKGLKLTAIHRVIGFEQKPWLKEYIDVNTKLRAKAKTDFEKDLYKLLNNAVFGKTMENVRGRIEYEIVQSRKRARSITQSFKFKSFTIINNDMVGVQSQKVEIEFNKPIYCGLTILDLSKLHMYKFHYDHMKPKYGDNIQLLATDTDSLIYHIKTKDLYDDMKQDKHLYDFGSYPANHPLFDTTNNKVIGKFKDETSGIPIIEFVGLAPKMYSIKLQQKIVADRNKEIQAFNDTALDKDKKEKIKPEKGTAKGIKKSYYKNHITHENYVRCVMSSNIEDMRQTAKFLQFRSNAHVMGTYEINKFSLTNYCNKRYIRDDGISSYSYGHYQTKYLNWLNEFNMQ